MLIGVKGDVITYTSDSFDTIYQYALQLIKDGKAYVDDTDVDTVRFGSNREIWANGILICMLIDASRAV